MSNTIRIATGIILLLAVPSLTMADTITFGTTDIPILRNAGPQTEGAFQYETLDWAWEVNHRSGDPPDSLFTFFNSNTTQDFPSVGQIVEITSPGNFFTFSSVDFRTVSSSSSDDVRITGWLGGEPVGTLDLTSSSTTFQTVVSPFSVDVDTLRLEVITLGSNAMALDNFVVTPQAVPEPSSLVYLVLGLATVGLITMGKRQRRRTLT